MLMIFGSSLVSVSAEDSSGYADNPSITSGNVAVAYCIDDDQFLYTDRIDERVAPTVATKLMTCMVVSDILKERNLTSSATNVTVTQSAIDNSGNIMDIRVPMLGLKVGNSYTAKDLISATLVSCANDAAAALASHFGEAFLGGGIAEFVDRMNKKAVALGLENTNFTNPTGLDAPNQYSTPRDIIKLTSAFYRYNELANLANVASFQLGKTTVHSKNYLKSNYLIKGYMNKNAIGVIAGQLDRSGNYCLIAGSQKDGRTYIFVVMCASGMIVERDDKNRVVYSFGEGNAYDDMNKLIDWTRNAFKLLTVATNDTIVGELRVNFGSSSDHVMIVPESNVEKLVPDVEGVEVQSTLTYDPDLVYKKEFNGKEYDTVNAPVTHGQRVGTVTYSYNGREIATVPAVTKEAVESDSMKATLSGAKDFLFGGVMKTILIVIAVIVALYVILTVVFATRRGIKRARKSGGKPKTAVTSPKKEKKTKTKKHDPKTDTRDFN